MWDKQHFADQEDFSSQADEIKILFFGKKDVIAADIFAEVCFL